MMNLRGTKIDVANSAFMNGKRLLALALAFHGFSLLGAPAREGLAVQELRLQCEEFQQKLHAQKVELAIAQEKIDALESALSSLRQDVGTFIKTAPDLAKDRLSLIEKRLTSLEKTQETLASDFKTLKNHVNGSNATLASCQEQLQRLEKQLSQDVLSLKSSLQSMITLLQKGDLPSDKVYVVKPGDSLGKIALEQKIDIKRLKECNQLTNDKIYVGQKLHLP